ncbi:UDP-N-acetylglucosamine 1-carboxyvinyltransferase [Candidatus Uhrbacteria bacterium]|nr:UDP-N-acetylglucosamine 1-carboxyvinyltransferase [Candidatus Uhrbacteria bacterium]
MSMFEITGRRKLQGQISVGGSKNAATPLLAASLLSNTPSTIRNVPKILDVTRMIELLELLGSVTRWVDRSTLTIDTSAVQPKRLRSAKARSLVKSMRSSVLLIGPLLARFGALTIPEPGGCILGKRPLGTHIAALKKLGATVRWESDQFHIRAQRLVGRTIILPEFSVTATENIMMAAMAATGTTTIQTAAQEPHVMQLLAALTSMGARTSVLGTHAMAITAPRVIKGFRAEVGPDPIDAFTMVVAAVLTNGAVRISPFPWGTYDIVLELLRTIGVVWSQEGDALVMKPPHRLRAFNLLTLPYPGFPTDLQSIFGLLATQCQGTSLIHDPLYEGRLGYIAELVKMGANAVICDPHRVLITGPTPLVAGDIRSLDLRAGATLVLAGLTARGQTVIHDAEIIDRGYVSIDERLNALGASIRRTS